MEKRLSPEQQRRQELIELIRMLNEKGLLPKLWKHVKMTEAEWIDLGISRDMRGL